MVSIMVGLNNVLCDSLPQKGTLSRPVLVSDLQTI